MVYFITAMVYCESPYKQVINILLLQKQALKQLHAMGMTAII